MTDTRQTTEQSMEQLARDLGTWAEADLDAVRRELIAHHEKWHRDRLLRMPCSNRIN